MSPSCPLTPFLTTFLGAFLGALSAFALEALRRRRKRRDDQFEGILAALSVLISQRNALLSLILQVPIDQNPFANLKHVILTFSQRSIDFSPLAFLGAASDPGLMLELDGAQEIYRTAVNTAELRNKMLDDYLNHPGTRLEPVDNAGDQMKAIGDPRLAKNLRQINDLAWLSIQKAEQKNQETSVRLYKFAMKQFPREKKIPFAIPKSRADISAQSAESER